MQTVTIQNKTYGINETKEIEKKVKRESRYEYNLIVVEFGFNEIANQTPYFSITGNTYINKREDMGGCIHGEIIKHFPELETLVKWHLWEVTGEQGLHTFANSWYFLSMHFGFVSLDKYLKEKPIEIAKNIINFGLFGGDEEFFNNMDENITKEQWKEFINKRKEEIQKQFVSDMVDVGVFVAINDMIDNCTFKTKEKQND